MTTGFLDTRYSGILVVPPQAPQNQCIRKYEISNTRTLCRPVFRTFWYDGRSEAIKNTLKLTRRATNSQLEIWLLWLILWSSLAHALFIGIVCCECGGRHTSTRQHGRDFRQNAVLLRNWVRWLHACLQNSVLVILDSRDSNSEQQFWFISV